MSFVTTNVKDNQTTYTILDCANDSRNNEMLLLSNFAGTVFPKNATTGQICFRTDIRGGVFFVFDGVNWIESDKNSLLKIDLGNAKGSMKSVSDRLRVSLNDDGTLKVPAEMNLSEWVVNDSIQPSYVSPNSFTVKKDNTGVFTVGRMLKISDSEVKYSYVINAVYDKSKDITTITINDKVLTSQMKSVQYAIESKGVEGFIDTHNTDPSAHANLIDKKLSPYAKTQDVISQIATHNTDQSAHADIRSLIKSLTTLAGQGGIIASNLAQNGWVKFANGLILQWGIGKCNQSESPKIIALPIPYKSFYTITGNDGGKDTPTLSFSPTSMTSFTVFTQDNRASGFFWQSVGF